MNKLIDTIYGGYDVNHLTKIYFYAEKNPLISQRTILIVMHIMETRRIKL